MGKIHWYKRDPDAALAGMMHLTLEERGAYNTVLDLIYSRDGAVPDDDRFIAGWMRADLRVWKRIRTKLLEEGKLYLEKGTLRNCRADEEVLSALGRIEGASQAGRASAAKRGAAASKTNNMAATRVGTSAEPLTPTPTSNPLTPASGGSEASQVEDEGEDENFYRRPLRANGTNPRALQEADESAERRRRASVRVKQWDDRLTQFETTGRWDTAWGPEPPVSAGFSPQGVLLPKPLWPRYQEISQRRIA